MFQKSIYLCRLHFRAIKQVKKGFVLDGMISNELSYRAGLVCQPFSFDPFLLFPHCWLGSTHFAYLSYQFSGFLYSKRIDNLHFEVTLLKMRNASKQGRQMANNISSECISDGNRNKTFPINHSKMSEHIWTLFQRRTLVILSLNLINAFIFLSTAHYQHHILSTTSGSALALSFARLPFYHYLVKSN